MRERPDINSLSGVRVLAVGDIMLDRYRYGCVERISPEAPVPVFTPIKEECMLGGVGNVVANLLSLGCKVNLVSRIGRDDDGKIIADKASSLGADASFFRQKGVATTVKIRLIASNNHLLRIDTENVCDLEEKLSILAADVCRDAIKKVDVVLLSDYAKGMLTESLCKAIIADCRRRGKRVIVDPKGADYAKYSGAFLVKPNLKELSLATNRSFSSTSTSFLSDVARSARLLARHIGVEGVLVTLSEHGMLYAPASSSSKPFHLPTRVKEVFDVSGAGDTAMAALGAALGAGFNITEAMEIANAASRVVVSKLGTATASLDEIERALSKSPSSSVERKVLASDYVADTVKKLRAAGKTIGFTNGCFDCCHLGHLHSLQEAKSLCDVLVVGVNSDSWIRRHKGVDRPIQDQKTRISLLASLSCVDHVVVFDSETALPLVRQIRPDVIAKEGYAIKDWPEGRFVRSIGGKAVMLKRIDGYSTTALAKKMECQS